MGSVALTACKKSEAPLVPEGKGGASLTAAQLVTCTAACERVLPADQDVGATQLGVVGYIDKRLAGEGRRATAARRRFRSGLTLLDDWSVQELGKAFAQLDAPTQDIALASLAAESTEQGYTFVRQLIELTLEGALADPVHGGNRDRKGWSLTGFVMPCPNPSCR